MKKVCYKGTFACFSDVGKVRLLNEDSVRTMVNASGNILMMVADGMGGHKKGEYASSETIRIISKAFEAKHGFLSIYEAKLWLKNIVKITNLAIYSKQESDPEYSKMGSTLVLCLIYKNKLLILNCGDSRCYLYKNGLIRQVTEDQTYVNYLVKCGEITAEEALTHPKRHVLTNAIGLYPSVNFHLKIHKFNGETILLCSDGLYNEVNTTDIKNILENEGTCSDKCRALINLANFNGGEDNSTAAIWERIDD